MPAAGPLTAASTGLGIARIAGDDRVVALAQRAADVRVALRRRARSRPCRSAPEENARPAPVIVTARTASSAAATLDGGPQVAPELLVPRVHRAPGRFELDAQLGAVGRRRGAGRRSRLIGSASAYRVMAPGRSRRSGWRRPGSASAPRWSARAGPSGTGGVPARARYVDAIQDAGGVALMLPPDAVAEDDPDEVLDVPRRPDPRRRRRHRPGHLRRRAATRRPATPARSATRRDRAGRAARSSATCRCSASAAACS